MRIVSTKNQILANLPRIKKEYISKIARKLPKLPKRKARINIKTHLLTKLTSNLAFILPEQQQFKLPLVTQSYLLPLLCLGIFVFLNYSGAEMLIWQNINTTLLNSSSVIACAEYARGNERIIQRMKLTIWQGGEPRLWQYSIKMAMTDTILQCTMVFCTDFNSLAIHCLFILVLERLGLFML